MLDFILSRADEGQVERIGKLNCFLNRFPTNPPVFSSTLPPLPELPGTVDKSLLFGLWSFCGVIGLLLGFLPPGLGIQLLVVG